MVSVLVYRHSADVCALHAGDGLAGVAAEIILRERYAFWLPGLFGELFIPFPSARQGALSAVPGYRNYAHRATDRRPVEVSGTQRQ